MTSSPDWRKATRSGPNGQCVEVAAGDEVRVRDSKDPGPELTFSREAFTEFIAAVKTGLI